MTMAGQLKPMARDNEHSSSDAPSVRPAGQSDETAAAEDPLVELARIVNRTRPSGGSVTSDRVGTTDYFAGLDDFPDFGQDTRAERPQAETRPQAAHGRAHDHAHERDHDHDTQRREPVMGTRQEPSFGSRQEPAFGGSAAPQAPLRDEDYETQGWAQDWAEESPDEVQAPASVSHAQHAAPAVRVEPRLGGAPAVRSPADQGEEEGFPALEDELIGAFRSSFDFTRRQPEADDDIDLQPRAPFAGGPADLSFEREFSADLQLDETQVDDPLRAAPRHEPHLDSADEDDLFDGGEAEYAQDDYAQDAYADEAPGDGELSDDIEDEPTYADAVQARREPLSDQGARTAAAAPTPAPATDLDALFAELGQLAASSASRNSVRSEGYFAEVGGFVTEETPAASDSLSRGGAPDAADLTEPASSADRSSFGAAAYTAASHGAQPASGRGASTGRPLVSDDFLDDPAFGAASLTDPVFDTPATTQAARGDYRSLSGSASLSQDIDDMAWPAAANRLPHGDDDEEAPPPEGYDLDAVAAAMQESDPTIGRSGVLPPHSHEEEVAVPRGAARNRKGLGVAAAVLGVVVLGGIGYALVGGGDSVVIPDGPAPVIAGLEGPLKVMEPAKEEDDSGSKLIYDRVDGTSDTSRERLILPEKTEPAALPPAPDEVVTTDPLVPGGPKKVRTLVVRPDGSIVSGEGAGQTQARVIDTSPAAVNGSSATQPAADASPATPLPDAGATSAETSAPAAPAANDPFAPSANGPDAGAQTATAPDPFAPAQDGTQPDAAAADPFASTASAEDQANAPKGIPRTKPGVSERTVVAAAQPVATQPVATQPSATVRSSGPLVLGAAPAAPVAAAPIASAPVTAAPVASGGSIPPGTYVVQVTSRQSEETARTSYQDLQRRFPSVLGSRQAVIVRADIEGKGTFYRARIPAGSKAEAISLCESLKAAGGDCFVRQD